MKRFALLLCLCLLLSPLAARSGGFQLNDHNARAVAMSFAVVSEGVDASTIFYNPAGMSFLREGLNISLGTTLIAPSAKFTGPTNLNRFNTTNMVNNTFILPQFFAAYKIGDLSIGFGLFVPFGAGTEWDPNWAGRNLNVRINLQNITLNPVIAYSLMDKKLSLAVGFTYTLGTAELRQRVVNFSPEPFLNLKGTGNTPSFNFGAVYEVNKQVKIGLSYRHNIKVEYKGDATFSLDAANTQPLTGGLNYLFVNGPGSTTLNLPFDARLGVSYKPNENLLLEFGVDLTGWSSYDTLKVNFDKAPGNPAVAGSVASVRNYKTTPNFRVGAEIGASESLKLRFGAYYDPAPVDAQYTNPTLPDANRLGLSAGFGFKLSNNISIDVGYLFVYGFQRTVTNTTAAEKIANGEDPKIAAQTAFNFNGIYNAWANVASVSVNFAF